MRLFESTRTMRSGGTPLAYLADPPLESQRDDREQRRGNEPQPPRSLRALIRRRGRHGLARNGGAARLHGGARIGRRRAPLSGGGRVVAVRERGRRSRSRRGGRELRGAGGRLAREVVPDRGECRRGARSDECQVRGNEGQDEYRRG